MISVPQLCLQIGDLPAGGLPLEGEVAFRALDPGDDGRLEFPQPLRFHLLVAPVQQGVLVRGRLESVVRAPCDRCLRPVEIAVAVHDACYHFPKLPPVGVLDLTECVREDILLALPQTCLCRDDCRGLCPVCGVNWNEHPCKCARPEDGAGPWTELDRLELP